MGGLSLLSLLELQAFTEAPVFKSHLCAAVRVASLEPTSFHNPAAGFDAQTGG